MCIDKDEIIKSLEGTIAELEKKVEKIVDQLNAAELTERVEAEEEANMYWNKTNQEWDKLD